MMPAANDRKTFVLDNTCVVNPLLCPEIRLRLITPSCPLWSATEKELAALALPDPFWGFCWAGGQALARFILDHREWVADRRVMVFGAGCGIEAIAAAKAGADFVLASDIDPIATKAAAINAALNGIEIETTTDDLLGAELNDFDVLLAGDMFYDELFAKRVLTWLNVLANQGVAILLGDPMRGNLCCDFLLELAAYQAPADVDLDGRYRQQAKVFAVHPPTRLTTQAYGNRPGKAYPRLSAK